MAAEPKRRAQVSGNEKQDTTVNCPTSVAITGKYLKFPSRINTFDGKKVGLLWNGKPNGDFFLNRVAELLEKKHKGVEIIKFWELDPTETAHPDRKSDEALDSIAKDSDIVIAAQGD